MTVHITNGDSAADIIKATGVPGDVLAWRDPMHHGPFQSTDLAKSSPQRSRYLSGGDDAFVERDARLKASGDDDEIVLWFEHDLLDQLQLLQLLDWLATAALPNTAINLICIDRFPGVEPFRGIGQLTVAQMASLYEQRQPVSAHQFERANAVFQAFVDACPAALVDMAFDNDKSLAFLGRALQRHLEEFPWCTDGLTRTERQLLQLIADGESRPGRLFVENMALETALYIGDWRTFSCLRDLAAGDTPLVRLTGNDTDDFLTRTVTLTEAGHHTLSETPSDVAPRERDLWLGGVHIVSGDNEWLWDPDALRLARPSQLNT